MPGASTASGTATDLVPVDAVFSPERKIQFGEDAAGKGGQTGGEPMYLALRCTDGEDLLGGVQRVRAAYPLQFGFLYALARNPLISLMGSLYAARPWEEGRRQMQRLKLRENAL